MKTTKKLIGTLLLLIVAQFAFANYPVKDEQASISKFRKYLIRQIGNPTHVKNANGQQVTVYFEINSEYKAEICNVVTDNPEIEKFIRAEFENMVFPEAYTSLHKLYSIQIKFVKSNNS